MKLKKAFLIFTLLFGWLMSGQILYSRLEKKTMTLGEVNIYRIRIEGLGGQTISIAPKNELLPFHFEEMQDTIQQQADVYERTIEFSIYEEGKFDIPSFIVKVGGKELRTVPYQLEVINSAQSQDQIADIMNNKKVNLSLNDYWNMYKIYVYAFFAFILLIIIIFILVKMFRRAKNPIIVATNQALKDLDALKKKKYIEENNYRAFYVELIDITRRFLLVQYQIPADVLLTDDLIDLMKHRNNTISPENEKIIEEVFLRGDMVKFAKIFPDNAVMEKDYQDIRAVVKRSIKDIEFENLRKDV